MANDGPLPIDKSTAPKANGSNGVKIGVTIPQSLMGWATLISKSGLWALVALWLISDLLSQRSALTAATAAAVAANGTAIDKISHKMDEAGGSMHAYVIEQQRQSERIVVLLLEVCVQQAEALKLELGTQRCFDAAHGVDRIQR